MAEITAAKVKELRERTGSGMMECKKALTEAGGDMEAAVEAMRKAGLAKADKKSGRIAAEGCIRSEIHPNGQSAVLIEINSETDFVSKGGDFLGFAQSVAQCALNIKADSVESLLSSTLPDSQISVEETRRTMVAKTGENITVRRLVCFVSENGWIASYLHGTRIGVLVEIEGGTPELGKDIAMHVAASRPVCVDETGVPSDLVEKEKAIFLAQAESSGKPPHVVEKMVEGRIKKFLGEITLLGQPFVKDPDQTVSQLLARQHAHVVRFVRFEVGEGIEKVESNFAQEVMAMAQAKDS